MWRRSQVAKAEVCKTFIHRFESDRRLIFLLFAGVAELVDARDLKSLGYLFGRASSILAGGIFIYKYLFDVQF